MTSLVTVRNLRKWFALRAGILGRARGYVHAVEDLSLDIAQGETLALVGESGCGKTTAGRTILRLLDPTSGSIRFDGEDLTQLSGIQLQKWRQKAQMIFQDPFGSLNPRLRIFDLVSEGIRIHGLMPAHEMAQRVRELLETVGLRAEHMNRYPHEFSGGQRQRIGMARALAVEPIFIVADEPVSALDAFTQTQILQLLVDLQESRHLAYLFISHDLRVVELIAHRVALMYLGRVMELLPAKRLRSEVCHPYSEALLDAVLIPDPTRRQKRRVLSGEVPSPLSPPSGCVFQTRCPRAKKLCMESVPDLREVGSRHWAACHLL